MMLSPHFTEAELDVEGCDVRLTLNAQFLCVGILEPIRLRFGAVRVHDGHRDPAHNVRAGGKATSWHLFEDGRAAADVDAIHVSCDVLFDWLRLHSKLPFDKVILETNADGDAVAVHIQVDRMNPPRRLAYTGSTGDGKTYTPAKVV